MVKKSINYIAFLKWKEENLGEILDSSLNEIYVFNSHTLRFKYVNGGARNNLGYSLEKLLSMTPIDIKPEFTLSSFHKLIRPLLMRTKKILIFETVHLRADGTRYPVEAHLQLISHEKHVSFLALILDITERRKKEEALRESEHHLSLTIRNAPVGLIEWDKDFQVKEWNPAAEKIFGYLKEEVMGKHANIIIPKEIRPHVDEIWKQLLTGVINLSINDNITKDGKTIVCEWHNAPLTTSSGKVFGVVSMMQDITVQKKSEVKLRDTIAQLEKTNQLMVGRELKMIELKKTINELEKKFAAEKK